MADKRIKMKSFQADFMESEARFPAFIAGWGTGKTLMAILKGLYVAKQHKNNLGLIVRKEYTDLRDSTIKDFEDLTELKVPSDKDVKLDNGSVIMFRHGDELDVLQNINLGWFVIEQAEEFETDTQFQMLRGRLRRAGVPHFGAVIANTKGHNWIWQLWKALDTDRSKEYFLSEATTFDNAGNLPADFIEDLKHLEKESPHHYNRFVMNSWEDVDTEDKVIPYSHIMTAIGRTLIELRVKTLVACDPCEFGNDEGIIYGLKNGEIIRHDFFRNKDGSQIAAKCQIMRKEIKGQTTVLDNIGIGASTRDFLSKMGEPMVLADSRKTGSRTEDKFTGFFNQRAEMWWAAKKMFAEGMVSIPDDPELIEELAAVGFELTSKGYKVESKELLKKADRLGRSPNKADCLIYGLWGLGKIDFDDEAIYPDDDTYLATESDIAESYSIRTAV